jgi:hypothetical protein
VTDYRLFPLTKEQIWRPCVQDTEPVPLYVSDASACVVRFVKARLMCASE